MWSVPIKRTALDGTEYNLLLLDSEGIDAYDQTGTYSIQIFSLAVLLSSTFIYNQMGGIDEAALDRLALVTEMTKHVRVRASGGRSTTSELGQFSPVFVWLLRDFYLDLAEDNRKITPRDYLELALRSVQGSGKNIAAKNEIRESIRALFPDRECFTLVRPLNNEHDLQRLDQIPLDRLRPEFRSGLDALTKFVLERSRPKQVGATTMTGPVLIGLTQTFLDAFNNGAVPAISSSWKTVEEAECHKAYDFAVDVYNTSFDRTRPAEEPIMREAHEAAVQNSLAAFGAAAVGAGPTRVTYEKRLHNYFRKTFEDYSRTAFLEADLRCQETLQCIEKKLRAACQLPDIKLDYVIQVLDSSLSEYETSAHGPGKWKLLAAFLLQCLEGPVLDVLKKQLDHAESEKGALLLKCRLNEDKLMLLRKQLDENEKHKDEYMKRYEEVIKEKQKISEDYSSHISNLQSKCSTMEERCSSVSKALNLAKRESSDWKIKYDDTCIELTDMDEKYTTQIAALESRINAAEGRLAAAREQSEIAQEEASEWKRKYAAAVDEVKKALERAALAQERTIKGAREREDALRATFLDEMSEKEEEIKNLTTKLDNVENLRNTLVVQLKDAESNFKNRELEVSSLKDDIKNLMVKLESVITTAQSHEKEARILEQEKHHLQEKYSTEHKKLDEISERYKAAENDARKATELADIARAEAAAAQKERSEIQRLAIERLAIIEKTERQVDYLKQENTKLVTEVSALRQSETDAYSKIAILESRVDEREREIEEMLNRSNEQRSSTVQVLEKLLATERAAAAEANSRAEALSLQLQATQGKLDALHHELTSVRLNETALDSKLRTVSHHGKRSRAAGSCIGAESVEDMDIDGVKVKGKKRSKSTTSPSKYSQVEEVSNGNEENQGTESCEDYAKFTVQKLKQKLTEQGFGAELLQLKTPSKKEIIGLYEKHVLNR
ncbi:plectin-like [Asparagus officinalis]|nr:plectin-like [Asparagus officinalis]